MHSYCSRITDDTFHAELTGDEMREIIVAGMIAKGMKIPDRFDIELTLDASQFTWREISHASLVWCDRKTTRVDFNIIDDPDNVILVNRPAVPTVKSNTIDLARRLQELAEDQGCEGPEDLMNEIDLEGTHPAICVSCGDCTMSLEPDSEATCGQCGGTVLPPLRLMGGI